MVRAEYLFDLQEALKSAPQAQKARRSDVVRAAVVLAVAAMDAYFTDKYCSLLVPYIKKHGANQRIEQRLTSAGLDIDQALQMALMKRPHARVLSLMRRHLDRKTTQGRKAIDGLYKDYRIDSLVQDTVDAVGRKTLFRRIEILVDRRHQIAHSGDLNAKGKANQVKYDDLKAKVADIKVLVHRADYLLYEKLGELGT